MEAEIGPSSGVSMGPNRFGNAGTGRQRPVGGSGANRAPKVTSNARSRAQRLDFSSGSLGDLEGLSDFLHLHDNRLSSLPSSFSRLKRFALFEYQQEPLRGTPRMRRRHDKPDRASGIGQSDHLGAGFASATGEPAGTAFEEHQAQIAPGIDRGLASSASD